jgi:hypothetical protein
MNKKEIQYVCKSMVWENNFLYFLWSIICINPLKNKRQQTFVEGSSSRDTIPLTRAEVKFPAAFYGSGCMETGFDIRCKK